MRNEVWPESTEEDDTMCPDTEQDLGEQLEPIARITSDRGDTIIVASSTGRAYEVSADDWVGRSIARVIGR